MGTSIENFIIKEQRKQKRIIGLNMVNPDNITVNQRRNETNGNIISNATGWVEIKFDKCQGRNFSTSYNNDPIYYIWKSGGSLGGMLIHFYEGDEWKGCTQVKASSSNILKLIARMPPFIDCFYIDVASKAPSYLDEDWSNISTSLTKDKVVSNLMIFCPTLTSDMLSGSYLDTIQELLDEQKDAPYIYGFEFEPYSDSFSPSPNLSCSIPVTKCPEGYTAVLGIGGDSIDKLQKFNFPSDLELYPGEYIDFNEMVAHKFSKKLTIDSSTPFADATLLLGLFGGQINVVRVDIQNPFDFIETENVMIQYFGSSILSEYFISPEIYMSFIRGHITKESFFPGWLPGGSGYDSVWDGYFYIYSDIIKTAEDARTFFATHTTDIVFINNNDNFIREQTISIGNPLDLNLTFSPSEKGSLIENQPIYCYFTPILENGDIDPNKNTSEYRKKMWFEFDAYYMKNQSYDKIVKNEENIKYLRDLTYFPSGRFSNTNIHDSYSYITYMHPETTYIFSNPDQTILNINSFGKCFPGDEYTYWIRITEGTPIHYRIIILSSYAPDYFIKAINFPANVAMCWKNGIAPTFNPSKSYKIDIVCISGDSSDQPNRDSKETCLCSWEEY